MTRTDHDPIADAVRASFRDGRPPRPRRLAVWLVAVVVVALALLAAAAPMADDASSASAPVPCDWYGEYNRTLAALGDDGARWHVQESLAIGDRQIKGTVSMATQHAYVSRRVPCEWVSSVVRHEWMHQQQMAAYGGGNWIGPAGTVARGELVADCGSMLLGSTYTPVVESWEGGCGQWDLAEARRLITNAHR